MGSARAAQARVALVVGNSAYRDGALKNPVDDAQAIAETLRGLDFDVTLRENTWLRDLIEAFRQFSLAAPKAACACCSMPATASR